MHSRTCDYEISIASYQFWKGVRELVGKLNGVCTRKKDKNHWSRINAVEMSYLREAYFLTRWGGESNESVYERWAIGETVIGVAILYSTTLRHCILLI